MEGGPSMMRFCRGMWIESILAKESSTVMVMVIVSSSWRVRLSTVSSLPNECRTQNAE